MEPLVTDNPQESRYEIHVAPATADADLPQLAGFAQYHRFKDEIAFIHTEIDPKFEGQGLGGKLARAALDDAREKGLAVLLLPVHPRLDGQAPGLHRPRPGRPARPLRVLRAVVG
ncbi:GNAT family N-acetyltransferase [Streptacidiphilus monticola]